jgi:hypothetical protein
VYVVPPLERELAGLLIASRIWANHRPVDQTRVRQARDAALIANHQRYVASIPVYSRMAAELGHTEVEDVATIIDELLVGVSLFKSYDDSLLDRRDFRALTEWVSEVSTLAPEPRLDGIDTFDDWRARMRDAGVVITVSSGTSGRPSLVPRDAATMAALRNNGRCYSMLAWGGYVGGEPEFDCLLVTRPDGAQGLHAVATGLAHLAGRSLFISDVDDPGRSIQEALVEAAELVELAHRDQRQLLVFGAPAAVARLCVAALERRRPLLLPDDALLVTGGGWKGGWAGQDPADFPRLVEEALALSPEQVVDVYGLSECNAYMLRCAKGRYHVPPVLEAVVVDQDLRARTGTDETGLIALLDPFAFSYPGFLLTGDWGRLVRTTCLCGLEGPGFVGDITRAPGQEAKGCAGVSPGVMA